MNFQPLFKCHFVKILLDTLLHSSDLVLMQEGWAPPELLSAGSGIRGDVCFAWHQPSLSDYSEKNWMAVPSDSY